ncbi:hypothetical protein Pint_18546 [Pistacia integerrima]|uniref:Uncharacterized protein n=1 Tax=Pistacia integerrima TaxID=434235 RepID=A0ACC0Z2L7_9ROSI|nr:hypothetical protein Pint_18546 [Pistacia integerrima]
MYIHSSMPGLCGKPCCPRHGSICGHFHDFRYTVASLEFGVGEVGSLIPSLFGVM